MQKHCQEWEKRARSNEEILVTREKASLNHKKKLSEYATELQEKERAIAKREAELCEYESQLKDKEKKWGIESSLM